MSRSHYRNHKSETSDRLGRSLCYVLRHEALKLKLPMQDDGFVPLSEVLKLPVFSTSSQEEILKIVAEDNKKRYSLRTTEAGVLEIRANQGHSINLPELDLKKITDTSAFPVAVHGTTKVAWQSIKNEGLKRMSRTHIHLASGVPGDSQVISGMRNSSQIWIFVDLEKAVKDGIEFFLSANQVILCKGVGEEGFLPCKYFSRVVDAKTSSELAIK